MQLRIARLIATLSFITCSGFATHANEDQSPFTTAVTLETNNGIATLSVAFTVPSQHRLYADTLAFELGGKPFNVQLPEPSVLADKHSGGTKRVYEKGFSASAPMPPLSGDTSFTVSLHGCNNEECFFPEIRTWLMRLTGEIFRADRGAASNGRTTEKWTDGFQIVARTSGYQPADKFLAFLSDHNGKARGDSAFAGMGVAATIGLILLGGLALNLTPCVLPMIPINLAILGAGSGNRDRRRGFALGAAYGLGMASMYGGLGLAVVLTGSRFGALNSSAWFNFGIAAVFVVLGLAMLDRINIDLSRFRPSGTRGGNNASAFVGAATMGTVSALLAGACVAPVIISVLLLATTLYQQGSVLGLLLPFVLGIGMALPWPFAAAGLAVLPKPGAWMNRVKHAFAILIFGFALWYGALGWGLLRPMQATARGGQLPVQQSISNLRSALDQASTSGQPVVIDFWASWCKNCSAMEHTTLLDAAVRKRLRDFTLIKFQAEHLNDPALKAVLDEFGVMGLPTYVVMRPAAPHPVHSQQHNQ